MMPLARWLVRCKSERRDAPAGIERSPSAAPTATRRNAMLYTLSLILAIDGAVHVVVLMAIVVFMMRLHRRHIL
jgi:hypothetical protein